MIDRIRFTQRRLSPDSIEDILAEPADVSKQSVQTVVEAKEAYKALQQLRPEQKQVLQLSIIQGMSHQEIADATGMPLGTVKTHARRGLIQAREIMGLGDPTSFKEVAV